MGAKKVPTQAGDFLTDTKEATEATKEAKKEPSAVKKFSVTCKDWANSDMDVGGTIIHFNINGRANDVNKTVADILGQFTGVIVQ